MWLMLAICFMSAPTFSLTAEVQRSQRLKGTGLFEARLRIDRTVERVTVLKSTGHRELDEHAISMLGTWRFAKVPTAVRRVKVPVSFR